MEIPSKKQEEQRKSSRGWRGSRFRQRLKHLQRTLHVVWASRPVPRASLKGWCRPAWWRLRSPTGHLPPPW